MSNNIHHPPGPNAALASLYRNFGASSNQDTSDNALAAQASVAPLSQPPTSEHALSVLSSSAPFDIQSILYAQRIQQLASAQQVAVQQRQQQQAQSPAALLSSLPPDLLQTYLAAMTSQTSPSLSGLPPFIGSNAMSYKKASQQHQQTHSQAQATPSQILASSINQSNRGIGTQHPHLLAPTNAAVPISQQGIFVGDLMEMTAKGGSTNCLGVAGTSPGPALLNHHEVAAQTVCNTSRSSDSSTSSVAVIASPAASASGNSSSPSSSTYCRKKKKLSCRSPTSSSTDKSRHTPNAVISEWEDKKLAKRAANRLSAHLSRKRKKMFIDDLTAENTDLRRKVQILQTIPDLIVVFDSSGCISFISQSVSTLLDVTNQELEGTSFWDCLAEDSVKMIKSAFMDALAEKRKSEDDPTPLCHGDSLLVKLVDKNAGDSRAVSLKGVVHFTGVAPECVCSIRPIETGVPISHKGYGDESQDVYVHEVVGGSMARNVSDGESIKTSKTSNASFSS
eukprot:CCRYP_010914-RB/>CCRYP_010914-RB protein AED:0.04 eAED:0.04 QI:366/1/1/1/0.5/0.33/3/593/507